MFCERCGAQLPDTAEFCTSCGTNINKARKNTEKIPDTEIQFSVKPTFNFIYMVLPSIISFLFVIMSLAFMFLMISVEASIGITIIGFVLLAIIVGINTIIKKKQYDSYYYEFYNTKVIYRDSFLNISEKEIKYKYIREATMRQTFIQKFFDLGNIVLFTNAETGFGNGIYIMNVKNVQEVYRRIKEIINV